VTPPDANEPNADDEPDEPIAVLRDLELEPRGDLPLRVRRGIERRFFARDLLTLSWTGLARFATEWLTMLFSGLTAGPTEQKRKEEP
jgi:hypothetical protein